MLNRRVFSLDLKVAHDGYRFVVGSKQQVRQNRRIVQYATWRRAAGTVTVSNHGQLLTTEPHNELHLRCDLVFTEVVC